MIASFHACRIFEYPEAFLRESRGKRIVLDEGHRLMNPSELLKIAADHFPNIHILATVSYVRGAQYRGVEVRFVSLTGLIEKLTAPQARLKVK